MIENLNQTQQMQLGYFKALELTNASNKIKLIKISPQFNRTITNYVRTLLTNKSLQIGDTLFEITDPKIQEILTYSLKLFEKWRKGLINNSEMNDLSCKICLELKPWIFDGLIALHLNVPEYNLYVVEKINKRFLND